ncbi:MAG: twin-arginine translocase TatA/TatE family subunit [Trueperaceae bacterium]
MRIGPLGIWELLIILVVVLLIFGPRRLPEMAKGIGQSVREFRKGIRDMKDDFEAGASKDDQQESNKKRASAAEPANAASATPPATPAAEAPPEASGDTSADATADATEADGEPVSSKQVETKSA